MWYKSNKKLLKSEKNYIREYNIRTNSSLDFLIKNNKVILAGKLCFSAIYLNDIVEDNYKIDIFFPDNYPVEFPFVKEIDNKIDKNYHHFYSKEFNTKFLCLGTPTELSLKFSSNPCLKNFFNNCLIPYLFNYSYKLKYKNHSKMEERPHGTRGIKEFFYKHFNINKSKIVIDLLYYLFNEDKIDNQIICPCGNNKTLKECHYKKIIELKSVNLNYILSDCKEILEDYNRKRNILNQSIQNTINKYSKD